MIEVGKVYRYGNELHNPFAFVVVGETDDFRNGPSDDVPKPGFVCMVLLGRAVLNAMFRGDAVHPGATFACSHRSAIAVDAEPYDGSVPV